MGPKSNHIWIKFKPKKGPIFQFSTIPVPWCCRAGIAGLIIIIGFKKERKMDIISQLQEQVNTIAALAFNTFGTLQRDAHPVKLSPNYPDPPPPSNPTEDPATAAGNVSEQPKLMSAALVKAAKQVPLSLSLSPNSTFYFYAQNFM